MIDWGDGTIEPIIFTTPSHTYTNPGTYTIKMSGITGFAQFGFGSNYHGKLTTVTSWGGIAWTDVQYMFYRANRLTTVPALAPDLSNIVDVTGMFQGASQFNSPIGSWDVSNVTNMAFMFGGAFAFNQPLNNWNVSNVTDLINFMNSNNAPNGYSVENYSNLLIGWASRTVKPNISINFSTNKYNAEASASRSILRSPPNNWTIADGGQI